MQSLRFSLMTKMLCGTALLLVLFGAAVYALVRRDAVRQFDASLLAMARTLAASVKHESDRVEMDLDVRQLAEFQARGRPSYFQLWREDGHVELRSPSLGERTLPGPAAPGHGKAIVDDLLLPDGRAGRAAWIVFTPNAEDTEDHRDAAKPAQTGKVILAVARNTAEMAGRLHRLLWVLGSAGAAVMALSLVVAHLAVSRGLRPLGPLARRIASITADNLAERVAVGEMPSELVPVGEKLNDLLARLEAAFQRERAFTSDVAHELRTPLAGVLSTIEVGLSRPRQAEEYHDALNDCLTITRRMQTMIDGLLSLARLDAGQATVQVEEVNLRDLVEHCWSGLAGKAASRGVTFENRLGANVTCLCGRLILTTALQNILDNAGEYVNEDGRVWVTGRRAQGGAELEVFNTGARLSSRDVTCVFRPFWRADTSRTDTGVHCGLGLALVARCVAVLGGAVSAGVDEGVFRVELVLPDSPPSA